MNMKVKSLILLYIIGASSLGAISCTVPTSHVLQKLHSTHTECIDSVTKQVIIYPKCSNTSEPGEICSIAFADIRPTQFTYGDSYVLDMKQRFTGKPSIAQEFFCKKPPSLVIGPKNAEGFYLTDGHHRMKLAEKLMKEDSNIFTILVQIDKNIYLSNPDMDQNAFWDEMIKNNDVYLKDKGISRSPEELPKRISNVTNDPYRSLAGFIADDISKFCFDTSLPSYGNFAEFFWGDYFRETKGFENYTDEKNYQTIKERIQNYRLPGSDKIVNLCKISEAEKLPGYIKD
ncbi:ParB/Srx family N-terminal domain-containing protein [Fluviispira sanaruensis]|uniref:Chromosome partitioning protein ParB n=1 Tax=Fluviispira sanaruensis TaxID=2493639 RepID=A0A4P2VT68_FLUSA|nr:ParB/Srx family N-terminal domain-containing protein [Fluviispira sanaruensis]BBH52062.1 chromosome partitioning protein ParB [Fluviispira sanaruensis]